MSSSALDNPKTRIRIVLLAMLVGLISLGCVLWSVQILKGDEYRRIMDRQSQRRVRLPGARGRIVDRYGICLADNRPSYCIGIAVEDLQRDGKWKSPADRIENAVDELTKIIGLPRTVTRRSIEIHVQRRRPLPFLAWRDVGEEAIARWSEAGEPIRGVTVIVNPVRVYPHGRLASHVIGYVGRADLASEDGASFHYYMPEMKGARGVEKTMNGPLAGRPGEEAVRIDVEGFRHAVESATNRPSAGMDVVLALDSKLQAIADEVMGTVTGAVVVLDPRNGDVLTMVSSPSFDPNTIRRRDEWRRLNTAQGRPLYNRAVSGVYPPGSIFKPLVAIAALENRRATADTSFTCPGYFEIGGVRFRCWRRSGHGRLAMRKSLEQSCNAYYCQLGLKIGYERIYHMAEAMGFGRRTGIDLDYEMKGLLPDNAWKVRRYNDQWRSGDTCNVSIGQGALLATPLQMAVFVATLANRGCVYRPRLVLSERYREEGEYIEASGVDDPLRLMKGDVVNLMRWSPATIRVVRGGMYDVVQAPKGTGKRARVDGVKIGGKTGTAEYGPRSARKKHAWMIAFAPFDEPRYAIAIVIENATAGGVDAAPRVAKIIRGAMELESARIAARKAEHGEAGT